MPGIITHNKIFKDSIDYLTKKKKKNYLLRSLATLFSSREYIAAGLFGSIGPNIFDYIPFVHRMGSYGNDISFFLHNEGYLALIERFIQRIFSYEDKNK